MANLVYSAVTSIDGYVADEDGKFDWAAPDDEVHAFINDHERSIGTYLYGRRLYQVMLYWESLDTVGQSEVSRDFAEIWRAADKVVFSTTLAKVASARTRLERRFDPAAVRRMKAESSSDISIGGPSLAATAIRADVVDEVHLFVTPVAVGGGTPAMPPHARWRLELVDQRRFGNGVVHLHYRSAGAPS